MDDCSRALVIDATPHLPSCNNANQNIILNTVKRETLKTFLTMLDEFTIDDYKSILFLLLDYSTPEEFLSLTKKTKSVLKKRFHDLFIEKLSEEILLEMLGTMKLYEKLKSFNTCCHIFKEGKYFAEIREIRKVLYSLCEEVTDEDLNNIKQYLPYHIRDEIVCAEEWFAHALHHKIITDTDLTNLKQIFKNHPDCLQIINQYKGEPTIKSYFIRTTTVLSHCGIAVIFNFTNFKLPDLKYPDPKRPELKTRDGSDIDVDSLKKLWNTFGFQTIVHDDFTRLQLEEKLEEYAAMDHTNYDLFVGCFLSHGDSGVIYTSDAYPVPIQSLLAIITEKCVTLEGKPKLFFIQACQGTKSVRRPTYQGILPKSENLAYNDKDSSPEILDENNSDFPTLRDVFQVKSTVNGYISWRSEVKGGIFIQILCNVMMECGDKHSMDDIMTIVTARVSTQEQDAIQIVPTYKTLCKRLMLKKRIVH